MMRSSSLLAYFAYFCIFSNYFIIYASKRTMKALRMGIGGKWSEEGVGFIDNEGDFDCFGLWEGKL